MSSKSNQTIDHKVISPPTQIKLIRKNKKTNQIDELECDKETALILVKHGWKTKREDKNTEYVLLSAFYSEDREVRYGYIELEKMKDEWLKFADKHKNKISFDLSAGVKSALEGWNDKDIAKVFLNTWNRMMLSYCDECEEDFDTCKCGQKVTFDYTPLKHPQTFTIVKVITITD